jgi:hypothetical protein
MQHFAERAGVAVSPAKRRLSFQTRSIQAAAAFGQRFTLNYLNLLENVGA